MFKCYESNLIVHTIGIIDNYTMSNNAGVVMRLWMAIYTCKFFPCFHYFHTFDRSTIHCFSYAFMSWRLLGSLLYHVCQKVQHNSHTFTPKAETIMEFSFKLFSPHNLCQGFTHTLETIRTQYASVCLWVKEVQSNAF